ncbi:MAG: patatin-like phospholipase family protein [Nitriliruptorales bacterium]
MPTRRALVLSGGANRGAMQAGAVRTLIEHGLEFDLLVGTSAGALNAVFLASGPTPERARQLVEVWRTMTARDIVGERLGRRVVNALRRRDHLYAPTALRRFIARHAPMARLQDAAVPTVVVAVDLLSGQERDFSAGPVVDLVAASAAIPGIYPPVAYGDDLLVDGGVLAPVPIAAAIRAGATELWVLDVAQPCVARNRPASYLDCLVQSLTLQATGRTQAEIACPPPGVTIHHLPMRCRTDRWFSDFSGTDEMLTEGAEAARAYLATLPADGQPVREASA